MRYSYTFTMSYQLRLEFLGQNFLNPSSVDIYKDTACYGAFGKCYHARHNGKNFGIKMGCHLIEIDFVGNDLIVVRSNRKIDVVFVDLVETKNPPTDADSEEAAMAAREDWNAVVDKEDWTMVIA